MLFMMTIVFFCLFVLFQTLYIFIPLYLNGIQKNQNYSNKEKGMTLLIPAFNEYLVIQNCLMGILNVKYNNMEVIIINDGSTDKTFEVLDELLILKKEQKNKLGLLHHENVNGIYSSCKFPHIYVIDKVNGGKADALNAGIEFAQKEIIITLDADSILEPNALKEMNEAFNNEDVISAGGMVNIIQGFKNDREYFMPSFKILWLIRFQVIQYLTTFYLYKITQAKLSTMTVIAGAFGAFRKNILLEIGGYRKTVGEDMDITIRIQELIGTKMKGKRIDFIPEAICFTECPENIKSLFRQRIRWQKGFIDCVIAYRKLLYRKMNFGASTYLLFDSLILGTLCAYAVIIVPIILFLTKTNLYLAFLLLISSISIAILQNIATLIVSSRYGHVYKNKDLITLLLFIPLEAMFFRFTGLLFVSLGTILYFFDKQGWSSSERVGRQVIFSKDVKVNQNIGG